MNPCSRRGAGDEHSCAPSGSNLRAVAPGHNGVGQRPGRVQHRKTKRERNSARFGRSVTAEQRPGGRGPQTMLPPGWGWHSAGYAKSAPLEGTRKVSGSLPVIITQRRLSQHLGMFNREVKSAAIERLLGPHSEQEMEPAASPGIPGALSQASEPCCCSQASSVEWQPGTSMPVPHTTGEGSHTSVLGPSHSETMVLEAEQAPPNEKENAPPKGAKPGSVTALARELAQELQTHLDLTSMFLRRNLVSDRRQTILRLLVDRNQPLPSLPALLGQSKWEGDSALGALQSPGARGQELPLDPGSSSSRSSERGTAGKRRREQDLLCFGSLSPVHMVVKWGEEQATCKDLESRGTRKPTAAPSQLSGSSLYAYTSIPCAPQAPDAWPRGAPCCWGTIGEPRTTLGKATVAFRQAPKESAAEGHRRWHWLPFSAGEAGNTLPLDPASGSPWAEGSQHLCGHRQSPKRWLELLTQPHSHGSPWEPQSSQCLAAEVRTMERAASVPQPSFHVLRCIWSPNQPSQAGEASAPRVLTCPQPRPRAVSWGLCVNPKLPPQAALPHRQAPDPELLLPPRQARRPKHASSLLSVLGKPRGPCWKPVPMEPGEVLGYYQPRDSRAGGTWELPPTGGWAAQLPALQQLPLSCFPPSEVLEQGSLPLPTLHRQLKVSSPEGWAFPRMKLY